MGFWMVSLCASFNIIEQGIILPGIFFGICLCKWVDKIHFTKIRLNESGVAGENRIDNA